MSKAARIQNRQHRRDTTDSAIGYTPPVRSITFEEMDRAMTLRPGFPNAVAGRPINDRACALDLWCSICSATVKRWDGTNPTVVEVLSQTGTHARLHISPAQAGAQAAQAQRAEVEA